MNTLLFQLYQTLNCQTINNICLCLSCSIFVLQSKLTDSSSLLFWSNSRMTTRLVWFPVKKEAWNEAITNSGQLQNNCPLFVWQNQDNFMQSVISLSRQGLLKEMTRKHEENAFRLHFHKFSTGSFDLLVLNLHLAFKYCKLLRSAKFFSWENVNEIRFMLW